MRDQNDRIFIELFKTAAEKCLGRALTEPLSEIDSKLLSMTILERTGLVIGPKSLRNYSIYVFNGTDGRKENPSIATLDTLARYVVDAPKTDEASRKEKESHFPYWFQYKVKGASAVTIEKPRKKLSVTKVIIAAGIAGAAIVLIYLVSSNLISHEKQSYFEEFNATSIDSLHALGWKMHAEYQNPVDARPGHLQLFTLPGDNWGGADQGLKSMLWREISLDCFTTEIHLSDFFPTTNWQQVGLVLSEDESFSQKAIRLAISYNSFFGGYVREPEIVIQAVSSTESGDKSKPEEVAHLSIFSISPETKRVAEENLKRVALKIERTGSKVRLLYATGKMESFAFKEVVTGDFNFVPRYVAIYASQGLAPESVIPVYVDSFSISEVDCD